ncbi:MAG: indole-3-glycerol phosphate synthase TrpC [Proteobacteria bacterium]|nr:indole-3-glycerol phosphate synthase TrpC [Pseudomonadota bacterium]
MTNILESILQQKRLEVAEAAMRKPLSKLQQEASKVKAPLKFSNALKTKEFPAIIAEIKRASPSKGNFRPELDPIEAAASYVRGGATCISILTDEKYFNGSLEFVSRIKEKFSEIPLLRKDFIYHPYQIWQAKAAGADAVLLIVAALSTEELKFLIETTLETDLDILIEVHNEKEITTAVKVIEETNFYASKTEIMLGVNNRNLVDFTLDLNTAARLINFAKDKLFNEKVNLDSTVFVAESGIKNHSDLLQMKAAGVTAFLVGESLVMQGDLEENLKNLICQN